MNFIIPIYCGNLKTITMKKLNYVLQGVGNPDFQQYADIAPKIKGKGTLLEIKEKAISYIK